MHSPTHRRPLAQQKFLAAQTQNWDALLARQQEIYEELLANQELVPERQLAGSKPSRRPASARELTRDLVGWSPQLVGPFSLHQQQPSRR